MMNVKATAFVRRTYSYHVQLALRVLVTSARLLSDIVSLTNTVKIDNGIYTHAVVDVSLTI